MPGSSFKYVYTLAHKKAVLRAAEISPRPQESRRTASLAPTPLAAGKSPVPPTLPRGGTMPVTYIGASFVARACRSPARRSPDPPSPPTPHHGLAPCPARSSGPAGRRPRPPGMWHQHQPTAAGVRLTARHGTQLGKKPKKTKNPTDEPQ